MKNLDEMTLTNAYKIIGITNSTDREVAKSKFRALLKKCHTDGKGIVEGTPEWKAANDKLKILLRAWELVEDALPSPFPAFNKKSKPDDIEAALGQWLADETKGEVITRQEVSAKYAHRVPPAANDGLIEGSASGSNLPTLYDPEVVDWRKQWVKYTGPASCMEKIRPDQAAKLMEYFPHAFGALEQLQELDGCKHLRLFDAVKACWDEKLRAEYQRAGKIDLLVQQLKNPFPALKEAVNHIPPIHVQNVSSEQLHIDVSFYLKEDIIAHMHRWQKNPDIVLYKFMDAGFALPFTATNPHLLTGGGKKNDDVKQLPYKG